MIHHSGCLDASWNSVNSSLENIEGNQPPCLTINRTEPLLIESTSMTEHQTQLDPWPQPWLGDNDFFKKSANVSAPNVNIHQIPCYNLWLSTVLNRKANKEQLRKNVKEHSVILQTESTALASSCAG